MHYTIYWTAMLPAWICCFRDGERNYVVGYYDTHDEAKAAGKLELAKERRRRGSQEEDQSVGTEGRSTERDDRGDGGQG